MVLLLVGSGLLGGCSLLGRLGLLGEGGVVHWRGSVHLGGRLLLSGSWLLRNGLSRLFTGFFGGLGLIILIVRLILVGILIVRRILVGVVSLFSLVGLVGVTGLIAFAVAAGGRFAILIVALIVSITGFAFLAILAGGGLLGLRLLLDERLRLGLLLGKSACSIDNTSGHVGGPVLTLGKGNRGRVRSSGSLVSSFLLLDDVASGVGGSLLLLDGLLGRVALGLVNLFLELFSLGVDLLLSGGLFFRLLLGLLEVLLLLVQVIDSFLPGDIGSLDAGIMDTVRQRARSGQLGLAVLGR